jgi:membrane dipeptidase
MAGAGPFIDGAAVPACNRAVAEDMQGGGLTALNVVCSIWEDFRTSMRQVADLKSFIAANSDLLTQIYNVEDIERAKSAGKAGLVMSFANSSGFDDYLPFVELFHELGLRMVQITFNTANTAGSGCYEIRDSGLTDFGRELVSSLNEIGIGLNLTHLGARTACDVIKISTKPVCYTHCCPRALQDHFRNKTDDEMRAVADKGGVVGIAAVPHYLPSGLSSTLEDYLQAILYVLRLAGEDHVAIGCNMTQGQPDAFYKYVSLEKGNGRSLVDYSTPPQLPGVSTFRDYDNIASGLRRKGVPARILDKIMGRNWYRFYAEVW